RRTARLPRPRDRRPPVRAHPRRIPLPAAVPGPLVAGLRQDARRHRRDDVAMAKRQARDPAHRRSARPSPRHAHEATDGIHRLAAHEDEAAPREATETVAAAERKLLGADQSGVGCAGRSWRGGSVMKLTIAPLSDVPGWLAVQPPVWAADAHRETMQAWQTA